MSFEAPVDDEASLSIETFADTAQMAKTRFLAAYRPRSKEEQAQTAEQIGDTAVESIDATHKEMARDFARSMVSKLRYESISEPGLGDAAAWGGLPKSRALLVLVGNQSLQISLKRSEDVSMHQNDSIALAKELLKGCGE